MNKNINNKIHKEMLFKKVIVVQIIVISLFKNKMKILNVVII